MKQVKRILKWLFICVAGATIVCTMCEQLIQVYFNSKRPAATSFVKIDGANIHFVKKGEGGPTVVFQSGLGGDHKIWQKIQDSISQYTTTISYDRRGLLWSQGSDKPRTMASICAELDTLLKKTHCPRPYILVGHSLAGITLREFIQKHPSQVKGAVFIDVSHPDQILKTPPALQKYLKVPPKWMVTLAVETGFLRIFYSLNPFISDLPASDEMNQHIRNYFYKIYNGLLQEAVDDDPMFKEAKNISSFGALPLVILTGAYPDGVDFLAHDSKLEKQYMSIHNEGQKDLLNLSSASSQSYAVNSGHYVPLTDSRLVITKIKELLKK